MTWVGKATPIKNTAAADLYWNTETAMKDLVARFAPGTSLAKFSKIAGPAVIALHCADCGQAYVASSRADADSTIKFDSEARRRHRVAQYHRCDKCNRTFRDKKFCDEVQAAREKRAREEELRWMPYREYLGTDEWSERRKKVIRRAEFKCQVCAAGGRLHVHHRTYIRRGVERIEDMIALCADCHEIFHRNGKLSEGGRAA